MENNFIHFPRLIKLIEKCILASFLTSKNKNESRNFSHMARHICQRVDIRVSAATTQTFKRKKNEK